MFVKRAVKPKQIIPSPAHALRFTVSSRRLTRIATARVIYLECLNSSSFMLAMLDHLT